jgi:hypothetical protein
MFALGVDSLHSGVHNDIHRVLRGGEGSSSRSPQAAATIQVDGTLRPDVVALLEPGSGGPHILVAHGGVPSHAGKCALHSCVVSQCQGHIACRISPPLAQRF